MFLYEFLYSFHFIIILENYFTRFEVIEIGIRCVIIRDMMKWLNLGLLDSLKEMSVKIYFLCCQ